MRGEYYSFAMDRVIIFFASEIQRLSVSKREREGGREREIVCGFACSSERVYVCVCVWALGYFYMIVSKEYEFIETVILVRNEIGETSSNLHKVVCLSFRGYDFGKDKNHSVLSKEAYKLSGRPCFLALLRQLILEKDNQDYTT